MISYQFNQAQSEQTAWEKIRGFFSLSHSPSHADVSHHMALLISQATLLVLLALVYIGFEAYTVKMEASVGKLPQSRIREELQADEQLALAPAVTADSSVVLGTQSTAPTQDVPELQKSTFVIALTGDSMIETMGTQATALRTALKTKYPETRFYLYNYAKGARTVTQNLKDFHEPLNYKDRHYESIDELNPDVIIVGSSAYNLFDPHNANQHWLDYTRLVQEAPTITPNVYMLAEPAPLGSGFGIGEEGVMWEPNNAWVHTGHIVEQLNNVLGLSRTLEIPLIDAFTPSLNEQGQRGKRELINTSDNIHLSEEGHVFVAEKIAEIVDFEVIR